jgi:hypothetical protein
MNSGELQTVENELLDYGSQCPYAPNEPSCQSDYDWQDAYFKFCSERLVKLALQDWLLVASLPDLEILRSYLSSYVGNFDLAVLSEADLVILLSATPELAEKCDLSKLDSASWENLIENCGSTFNDAKYECYPEWRNVNTKEELGRGRIMRGMHN